MMLIVHHPRAHEYFAELGPGPCGNCTAPLRPDDVFTQSFDAPEVLSTRRNPMADRQIPNPAALVLGALSAPDLGLKISAADKRWKLVSVHAPTVTSNEWVAFLVEEGRLANPLLKVQQQN